MSKKITHEIVEASFNEAGYQLKSQYERNQDKLLFVCPNGHNHSISWSSWKTGVRCGKCPNPKRTPHEIVEASFKEAGYLLKSQYERCEDKLSFICPNGHNHSITWMDWRRGSRCGKCPVISSRKIPHEVVEASFNEAGYQLKSHYERCQDKLSFICPNGHNHSITWMDWRTGARCGKCAGWYKTQEEVESIFASEGYILLSEYKKSDTHLNYFCNKGHSSSITWESWKAGNRCDFCARNMRSFDYVRDSFIKDGYTLLTKHYEGCHQKLEFLCPEKHAHTTTWSNWDRGARCRSCAGQVLTEEQSKIIVVKKSIAAAVSQSLRNQKIKKNFSANKFGDSIAAKIYEYLGDRPEKHHLDHIIPQSFFDHRNQYEIEACWDINNLQWLPAITNLKKSKTLEPKDIAKFSEPQLDILRIASRKPRALEKYIPKKKIYAEQLKINFA